MALVAAKKVVTAISAATKNMSQENGMDGKSSNNNTCPGLTSLKIHAVLFMPQRMSNIHTPAHPTHSTHTASHSVGQIVCVREREMVRLLKVTLLSGLLCMALVAAKKVVTAISAATENMSQENVMDGKSRNASSWSTTSSSSSTCPGLTSLKNHALLFMPQIMSSNIRTPAHPTQHRASQ